MSILEMEDILRKLIEANLDYIANPIDDNYKDLCDVTILASAEMVKHLKLQDQYNDEEERNASRN
jgi:hypothetical protein